jgi:hypothetical protein
MAARAAAIPDDFSNAGSMAAQPSKTFERALSTTQQARRRSWRRSSGRASRIRGSMGAEDSGGRSAPFPH